MSELIRGEKIATAYVNLYAVACLDGKEVDWSKFDIVIDLDKLNTDDLLGFWHGIGMTPDKAFEYCEILEIDLDLTQVKQVFAELDTLV